MDPSILAAMDKEALKKQIENMKYQASMERWPLSKSIAAALFITNLKGDWGPFRTLLYSDWIT
ncbi:Guanine nucleotide-binding protein subunit gamma, partial [Operophtera brumata]